MRRKDWRYYMKTALLRYQSYQFNRLKNNKKFQEIIELRRKEYLKKLDDTTVEFYAFNPTYQSYFALTDSSIFTRDYVFKNDVPVRLSTQGLDNPLLPFYYGLVGINERIVNKQSVEEIIAKVDLVAQNFEDGSGRILYPYQEDYDIFELKAPWISGITQALACSFYLRKYHIDSDNQTLKKAKQIFQVLTVDVEKGGLLRSTSAGLEWVEEYPSNPPSYVLNGHIFAIIAAIEMYQLSQESYYAVQAKQWIKSLIYHLPEYQFKGKILHNKYQNKLSNLEYQGLYVGLFRHLHSLTQHPIFKELQSFYNQEMDWKSYKRFYGMNRS